MINICRPRNQSISNCQKLRLILYKTEGCLYQVHIIIEIQIVLTSPQYDGDSSMADELKLGKYFRHKFLMCNPSKF